MKKLRLARFYVFSPSQIKLNASAPVDSELIWKDYGSGAGSNLAVYRLIPAQNYKCLGDVTVGWPNGSQDHSPPELNNYRCVLIDYLTDIKYKSVIWDDRGTGE